MKRIRLQSIFILMALFAILLLPGNAYGSTRVEEDISTPTTWTEAGSPYLISTHIKVLPEAKLTLEAGTIIKFDTMGGIFVQGGFESMGTKDKIVYITSIKNDLVGGDDNEDVDLTSPQNNDWYSLYFETTQLIKLFYTNISYSYGSIVTKGTTIELEHTTCFHVVSCGTFYDKSHLKGDSIVGLYLSNEVLTVFNESSGVITNGDFSNFYSPETNEINDSAFTVFNDSSLIFMNPTINGFKKKQGLVDVFNKSIVNIDQGKVDFKGGDDMVTIFNDSQVTVKNVSFSGGTGTAFTVFNHGELALDDSTINNFTKYAIDAFGTNPPYKPNALSFNNVILSNNDIGLGVTSDLVYNGKNVQIVNNTSYGAYLYGDGKITLPFIWWGNDTGPYNALSNPRGTGNAISDGIIAPPYTSEGLGYYAKITNIPNGVANLYEAPTIKSVLVKTLPNDWIVRVVAKTDANNKPMISDGFYWYKVEDPTDNTIHYMISGTGTIPIYLPYEKEKQKEYEDTSVDNLSDVPATTPDAKAINENKKIARRQVVLDALDYYYDNNETKKSLYSSDDHAVKISKLKTNGFSKDLIRAFTAVEIGGEKFDNENVSYDYGHGMMQLTMKSYGIFKRNYNHTGEYSDISLLRCLNIVKNGSVVVAGSDDYKKCYTPIYNKNGKLVKQIYDHYEDVPTNPIYKKYENTKQSIYANIKDGVGILSNTYGTVWVKPCNKDWVVDTLIFSCSEISVIKTIWGYNGASTDSPNYLGAVSDRLKNLSKYFPGYTYDNNDKMIEKLAYAGKNRIELQKHSPVNIFIKDSKGNITGEKNDGYDDSIPNSTYDPESGTAVVFFPNDTYTYEVIGDDTVPNGGSYGLDINLFKGNDIPLSFHALDLPIKTWEIHTYSVNEVKLANNEPDAVTVKIDSNGDGIIERTVLAGSELSSLPPYDFYFKKPLVNGGNYKASKELPIRIQVFSNNKKKIPVLNPWIKVIRVSDGYNPQIDSITMEEDTKCESGDNCLNRHYNRYIYKLPKNLLTGGEWKIEVGIEDMVKHSIIINMVK